MVRLITSKEVEVTVKEHFILEVPTKQFYEELEDAILANQINNIDNFVKENIEGEVELINVKYKDNDINSEFVHIECERVTKHKY